MKGLEFIKSVTSREMPDKEQLRENCHRLAAAERGAASERRSEGAGRTKNVYVAQLAPLCAALAVAAGGVFAYAALGGGEPFGDGETGGVTQTAAGNPSSEGDGTQTAGVEPSGELSYRYLETDEYVCQDIEDLVARSDVILFGKVVGLSFGVLDDTTGLPPTVNPEERNGSLPALDYNERNWNLATFYDIDVFRLYKGEEADLTEWSDARQSGARIRTLGGLEGEYVDEQLAALAVYDAEKTVNIPVGATEIRLGEMYLFCLKLWDNGSAPTPLNLRQGVSGTEDLFVPGSSGFPCWSPDEIASYFGESRKVVDGWMNRRVMTRKDLYALAAKGENLTSYDFAPFIRSDSVTGSGIQTYLRVFDVSGEGCVTISANSLDAKYVRFTYTKKYAPYSIDLTADDVQAYIDLPPVTDYTSYPHPTRDAAVGVEIPGDADLSPDGTFAAFAFVAENNYLEGYYSPVYAVVVVEVESGKVADMLTFEPGNPRCEFMWSPDGRYLTAAIDDRNYKDYLVLLSAFFAEGSEKAPYSGGVVWSADNAYEAFVRQGAVFDFYLPEYYEEEHVENQRKTAALEWKHSDGVWDKILCAYEWIDSTGAVQSGTFLYDIYTEKVSDLTQN
ncbi:MAG: hypothetical protein LBI36_03595 [Oscillospiraceae bacterium]|jgi:hypothetical protein|nr:hypothetical protein [Oscillospiraceae bacterium]